MKLVVMVHIDSLLLAVRKFK